MQQIVYMEQMQSIDLNGYGDHSSGQKVTWTANVANLLEVMGTTYQCKKVTYAANCPHTAHTANAAN